MQDPHVVALIYRFTVAPGRTYKDPEPVAIQHPSFNGVLANDIFAATMTDHVATVEEAQELVGPILRTWEVHAAVSRGHEISFQFEDAEIVDRAPPPPGTVVAHALGLTSRAKIGSFFSAEIISPAYPTVPANFVVSPIVEILFSRFNQWRQGKESLYSMAYFCDTVLRGETEDKKGATRTEAAKKFAIEPDVLRKIGELSSRRGGDLEGRKAGTKLATPQEQAWLQAAVTAIILQVGATEAGCARTMLKLADLPPL